MNRHMNNSKTFCTLPFVHSHNSSSGNFKPCCNAHGPDCPPDATNENYTLNTWFHSDYMNQLRTDMLEGRRNPMCTRCWNDEDRSGHSIRTRMNERYGSICDVDRPQIKYLDLKLTNQCNLQCMMCSPGSSDKIASEAQQMAQQGFDVPYNYRGGPQRRTLLKQPDSFIKEVDTLLPYIVHLKITGGEPVIQPEVLALLDTAIAQGYSKNIELNLTTNGTKFNRRLLDKIAQFKTVKFNISVDGYGSVYDYIRYPFKWEKWLERIDEIKQYDIKCSYTAVPQLLNIENLHKLQQHITQQGDNLYLNNYLHPDGIWNSLDIIPPNILQYAVHHIKPEPNSIILINYIKQLLDKPNTVQQWRLDDMVTTLKTFDTMRNRHYSDYLERRTVEFIRQSGYTAR